MPRLAVIILCLIAILYSGIWFLLSAILHHHAVGELQTLNSKAPSVICDNLRKTGYPLRIGLRCDRLQWQDRSRGFTMDMGAIIAGAPIYAPSWRRLEITAPAHFEQEGLGTAEALWQHLTVNADFVAQTLHDLVIAIDGLQLALKDEHRLTPSLLLRSDFIRFQWDFESQTFLSADLSFDALTLTPMMEDRSRALPTINGEVTLHFEMTDASSIESEWPNMLRGGRGRIEKGNIEFVSGGGTQLEGAFYISPIGEISAQLTLSLRESASLLRNLQIIFPEQTTTLESLIFALNAMPKNEAGDPLISINIDKGQARAGFIPLGTLPFL